MSDVYRAAQVHELSEIARARRSEDRWQLIAAGLVIGLLAVIALAVSLASKYQHDVLVYRETPHGIALMSEGVQTRTPLESSVEHQLGLWVSDFRDVPGTDDKLAQRNAHNALVMTEKDSPAHQKLVALFQSPENPSTLGLTEKRTVAKVVASPVSGTSSYMIGWIEELEVQGKDAQTWRCAGSVAIAPPQLPTDTELAAIDPAGVFVRDYSLHCQPAESR